MLGREEPFEGVPYFWTNHFDMRFDYVGHAEEWDEVIFQPDDDDFPTFIAFYVRQGKVVAASACQRDLEITALHELIRLRRVPDAAEIRKGVNLIGRAKQFCNQKAG
jgi:hypothetical protein